MSTTTFRTTGTGTGSGNTAVTPLASGQGMSEPPASPGVLRAQARQVDALAEQLQLLLGVIGGWAEGLSDRLRQAGWTTAGITAAAEQVSAAGEDLDALTEYLQALETACRAGAAAGEHVNAAGAAGAAEAFAPA